MGPHGCRPWEKHTFIFPQSPEVMGRADGAEDEPHEVMWTEAKKVFLISRQ